MGKGKKQRLAEDKLAEEQIHNLHENKVPDGFEASREEERNANPRPRILLAPFGGGNPFETIQQFFDSLGRLAEAEHADDRPQQEEHEASEPESQDTDESPVDSEKLAAEGIENLDTFLGEMAEQFNRIWNAVMGTPMPLGEYKQLADIAIAALDAEREKVNQRLAFDDRQIQHSVKWANKRVKKAEKETRKAVRETESHAPGLHKVDLQNGKTLLVLDDLTDKQLKHFVNTNLHNSLDENVAGFVLLPYSVTNMTGGENL